jgi:hypothetical protein
LNGISDIGDYVFGDINGISGDFNSSIEGSPSSDDDADEEMIVTSDNPDDAQGGNNTTWDYNNDRDDYHDREEEQPYQPGFEDFCQKGRNYRWNHRNEKRKNLGDQKLHPACNYTFDDLCLAILLIRQQYQHAIGNEICAAFFSIFAEILPNNSEFFRELSQAKSSYIANQMLFIVLRKRNCVFPARTFQRCLCKEFTFSFQEGRQICQKCRKRKLTKFCPVYHSLPLTPRLKGLFSSRFYLNLLNYQNYRVVDPNVITVFDGTNWKYFQSQMKTNQRLIGIEISWDGTNPFIKGLKQMWPVMCSILNFPSIVRNQMHSGMHLMAIDNGSQAVWDVIIKELLDLWNVGFTIGRIQYRVALLRVVLAGRGLEKLTKTSGEFF